jgi:hypothetical protein
MTLLLCNWYKREELATRVAYLFSKSFGRSFRTFLIIQQLHRHSLGPLVAYWLGPSCTWMESQDTQAGAGKSHASPRNVLPN